MIVVTSGSKYIDIDAYASIIAYTILLNNINKNAIAVSTSVLNESIPSIIKDIPFSLSSYIPNEKDEFIILDISNPNMIDNVVIKDNIIEVIDHHLGYERHWKDIPYKIELIGAVATLIYEKYLTLNKKELLTKDLCKLLIAAILDNTLNLKADITTKRDIDAYNDLMKIGNIDKNFYKEYFISCEKEILKDLNKSIYNDLKDTKEYSELTDYFGQLTIYNIEEILNKKELIKKAFKNYKSWMINIISLKDEKSYIITNEKIKLTKLFNKNFDKDILELNKFMLRKEIIHKFTKK